MLFNSAAFLVFFPVVTAGYFLLPHRFRWLWLLLASCYFYMAFVPVYILILGGTIVVDYFAGIWIERSQGSRRKLALTMSVVANVGVLAFFKYWNFLNGNLAELLGFFGSQNPVPYLDILLPIGLSFHTFQALSYTIEVYRGNQQAERHFGIYALYVMFYPQLVAGPIERPQNMLHQFHEKHTFDYRSAVEGLQLMLWGFFKKVVIADRLAVYVNEVYGHPDHYQGAAVLLAIFFFAIQIYCDFSGYSNIALGAARVMGFRLMQNFNLPFAAGSVTEFWRRWHISLSTWLNDYLYTPLALRWRDLGKTGIAAALFVTFFISGLWHGAAWTYVVYGCLHGVALIWELFTKKWRKNLSKRIPSLIYNPLSLLLTFSFVAFTMIFFRAPSFAIAATIIRNALSFGAPFGYPGGGKELLIAVLLVLLLYAVNQAEKRDGIYQQLAKRRAPVRWAVYYSFILLILLLGNYSNSVEFIYFQF